MAHAFYTPTASTTIDSPARSRQYFHPASNTYFELTQHDGKFFQHRWQQGFDGHPENAQELPIDFVMGSGNHARTFLHREQDGALIELPLAWYPENGGHFAMNPGFDNPSPDTGRHIAYECMFCHNGYPEIPSTLHKDISANPIYTSLPQGIDCQRCHGPGAAHVKAAQTPGVSLQQVRAQILNPAHLGNDRQMEVCEQCHLETTSHLLPDHLRRYDREPFAYKAGESLSAFAVYFERDPAHGRTDNFEIVNSAYRLRQSRCYLKTQGALTCETCHNPHDLHKGPESAAYYTNICMKCHAADLPRKIAAHQHTAATGCVACHMPQRRTEDVVHAVMTDHLIQRNAPPASILLAARAEQPDTTVTHYHGPVNRYLLDHELPYPNDDLYNAAAQVINDSNSATGIPALAAAIDKAQPTQPNFSIELGDARRHANDLPGAIDAYRQALTIDPQSSRAQRRLGVALGASGQTTEALNILSNAIDHDPTNALLWYERAAIKSRTGDTTGAIADLHQTLDLKPNFADAQNSLGSALAQSGDTTSAAAAFHTALNLNPYDAGTHANLGRLLAGQSDWKQAAFQLQKAVQLDPANINAHTDYAVVLIQLQHIPQAEAEARAAIAADPRSATAHDLLGQILGSRHTLGPARAEFESALKLDPNFAPAQLDLAAILLQQNQPQPAIPLLQQAAHSPNPQIAAQAQALLQQLSSR